MINARLFKVQDGEVVILRDYDADGIPGIALTAYVRMPHYEFCLPRSQWVGMECPNPEIDHDTLTIQGIALFTQAEAERFYFTMKDEIVKLRQENDPKKNWN